MYDNIPNELKYLNQWCVWGYEDVGAKKPTKVPYNPLTGRHASVTDPSTWVSYEAAKAHAHNYDGIGFIFSSNDPYTFIDLDDASTLTDGSPNPNFSIDFNRQKKIFDEFDTYAEVSPSGKGLHLIVKANVLAGRKRSFVEIYSTMRYATMTGNVYHNKPIADCQELTETLWGQMGGEPKTYLYKGTDQEIETDQQIINQAITAINGEKFKLLLEGYWQSIYPTQSEADFALIDIIAFYSRNQNQIARIFRNSALGQRDKAKRNDYVSYMVNKSFDRMLPPIDIDGFKNALEVKIAERNLIAQHVHINGNHVETDVSVAPEPSVGAPTKSTNQIKIKPMSRKKATIVIPPGLMGEIAQFVYQASPRPIPEIALAASIGLMAGICGRAYNVSGNGLNQYILVLAKTGSGKESMATGIDRLMECIKLQVPTSTGFIGPSEIASGQALYKYMAKTSQCFVSILGEFGIRLQQMSSPTAAASDNTLRRMLLDLYGKSGFGKSVRPFIYSDKDKNTETFTSPNLTILGESTPERFYNHLNEDMISEGLLPRFSIIEYLGNRPAFNENHLNVKPSNQLIQKLADLAAVSETISHNKRVIDIPSTPEAMKLLGDFDKLCDARINSAEAEVARQLWNRAHLKVWKLAALVAIGINLSHPIIDDNCVKWALNLVNEDILNFIDRFDSGEVGSNTFETRQVNDMIRIIKEYNTFDFEKVKGYTMHALLHRDKIVPWEFISRRLTSMGSFKNDKMGAQFAIKRTVQMLIDNDDMREIPKHETTIKYGVNQRTFIVKNVKLLD